MLYSFLSMKLSDAHKAIVMTLLLASSVVLMAFNFHIKKQNELVAETFFEILPEDIFLEEPENLEDILESLESALNTNQAFNETRKYDDYEDEEFKETMDRLKNRNSGDDSYEAKAYEPIESNEDNSSFKDINDIIEKRSGNNSANKNSTIRYSLVDRDKIYIPPPIYLCEYGGKIVVNITVTANGNVTEATYNNSSSTDNGCLVDHAIEYAKASRFSEAPSKASQLGTITFIFKGKS